MFNHYLTFWLTCIDKLTDCYQLLRFNSCFAIVICHKIWSYPPQKSYINEVCTQLMIPNEEKRGRHMHVLLVGWWESRIASLWSHSKIKTQTHASSKTFRDYFNASNKYSSMILRENQNVCYISLNEAGFFLRCNHLHVMHWNNWQILKSWVSHYLSKLFK